MNEIWYNYINERIEYRLTFFGISREIVMHDHELYNELRLLNILTYVRGIAPAVCQCLRYCSSLSFVSLVKQRRGSRHTN